MKEQPILNTNAGTLLIRDLSHANELVEQVGRSATQLQHWIAKFEGDGIGLLRALKFDRIGFHPLGGHALNAIEQVNQVWTYLVALAATRVLFDLHPQAGAFSIAPGAHAAPGFPGTKPLPQFRRGDVEVWSVDV